MVGEIDYAYSDYSVLTATDQLVPLFAGLPELPHLRAFSLAGVCPHIAAPAVLGRMPALRELHITGTSCCSGDLHMAVCAVKSRLEALTHHTT